jgi:hypothetical protein
MSRAAAAFESSLQDAQVLLEYFDDARKDSAEKAEVLKRAGLVVALTAWETYVEDRLQDAVRSRLRVIEGSSAAHFVMRRLELELKRFHNPSSEKTKQIFQDYLDVDVTASWAWLHFDPALARKTLDELIHKRGGVVHRAKPKNGGPPAPHPVKREELERAIRFLKGLVAATDNALGEE